VTADSAAAAPFAYDAYVSHAEADRDWVEDQLVPRLEEAGRRVVLDQDLPPGGLEIEERSRAVAASRKTVLVVSRSFLDGRWAPLEEAVTRELDPAARKRRLVPVLRDDCEVPLRVRPLVAVDLRGGGSPRQWKRLTDALDPAAGDGGGLVQRLSLRLAEATADLDRPTWNGAGAAWMALVYLALGAVAALLNLLVWAVPPLRDSLAVVLLAPTHALGALVWREDRDLFRRLSHVVGGSLPCRGGVLALSALVAAAWWWAGVPAARAIACGPLGCRQVGKTYLTVLAFEAPSADFPDLDRWTRGTRRALEMKLSSAPNVAVLAQDLPQVDADALRRLSVDYTIRGEVDRPRSPVLTAVLYDRQGVVAPPPVEVEMGGEAAEGAVEDDFARIKDLQDRLAQGLLQRLGLALSPTDAARLARIPTGEPRAAKLNDEGFQLLREGDLVGAEARLRAALALDDGYSVAWSNLAEVAWRSGRAEEALTDRRAAVARLPTYAPFHYNLGHLLAYLGRGREAEAELRAALALDRAHVPSYDELGNVLLDLKEPAKAAEELRKGLLLDPQFPPLSKNLGRALLAGGEPAAAVPPLERALGLYPPADWLGRCEAQALLVEALAKGGHGADACRRLDELHRLDPDGVAPWTPAAEDAAGRLSCPSSPGKEEIHA
jgi:tetratricopeptide (TPR) repeat protein